jgi:hypothetical protein
MCSGERFDIIYLDFTDSLLSAGKSKSAMTLHRAFDNQRLASPGCLITNFTDLEGRTACDELLAGYLWGQYAVELGEGEEISTFCPREEGISFDNFRKLVETGREGAYGFMVTQYPALYAAVFSVSKRLFRSNGIRSLFVKGNPKPKFDFLANHLGWLCFFFEKLQALPGNRCRLRHELLEQVDGYSVQELAGLHNALTGDAYSRILIPTLADAVSRVQETVPEWLRIYCDIFFPENWVKYLMHQIGYPYFRNGRKSTRISYRAETRKMMVDIHFWDQCRPAFDSLGLLEMFGDSGARFDRQMLARASIDAISKSIRDVLPYLYHGANLYGFNELSSGTWWAECTERREIR